MNLVNPINSDSSMKQKSEYINIHLNSLVICSGSFKDDVIDKVNVYNSIAELTGKFKKIIIFSGNVKYHEQSKVDYPNLIPYVTDEIE